MGLKKDKIYIDLMFVKDKPELKKDGHLIGIDLGYRVPLATSDRQLIGEELKEEIVKSGKRRKSFHKYVGTEVNRLVKEIKLHDINTIILENLKNVKRNKRGKFSRQSNRLLSFWHYARATEKLRQVCEEEGIRLELKSPWKTSQRCPVCGKIDGRNRKDLEFKCTQCGFEEHSDIVGALNLRALGLAGVYSLRSLQPSV